MKKFVISPGIHNSTDRQFKPVTIKAKTWMRALTKALKERLIPQDAYSVQILEVSKESDDDEDEERIALHFREWREDELIKKYISPFEGWMI